MKEHPILFMGLMVRAILEGRKTQTRRVVKFSKAERWKEELKSAHLDGAGDWIFWNTNEPGLAEFTKKAYANGGGIPCPYGQPGDSLWVREMWQAMNQECRWWHEVKREDRPLHNWAWTNPVFPAYQTQPLRWLPSIHMPRAACRITPTVVSVRVERVQDISEEDAIAEGLTSGRNGFWLPGGYSSPILAYRNLWESINGKRPGCSWDGNPYVWVVEFTPVAHP